MQEASIFLKKRAVLEEDFGRTMHKLAATSQMAYTANECKAGYVHTLFVILELHHVRARLGGCNCRVIPKYGPSFPIEDCKPSYGLATTHYPLSQSGRYHDFS